MSKNVIMSALKNLPGHCRKILKESNAEIIADANVFYNPVQEFNRDLSVCVINAYFQRLVRERQANTSQFRNDNNDTTDDVRTLNITGVNSTSKVIGKAYTAGTKYDDGLRILEAFSATGLRSIRYAKEVAGIREIIANDLSQQAVEAININVVHNKVDHLVQSSYANATTLMYSSIIPEKRFDCIDLDPYGCPSRFLDSALQAIIDGGLLLITATDMGVLSGNAPEVCYVKYGSVPLRMRSCHELALRILLHCVDNHANRYGKYIVPLLSISADFYIRVFVRVFNSQAACKFSISKQSMIYQCTGCETFNLQPLGYIKSDITDGNDTNLKFCLPTGPIVSTNCEHCGYKHQLGGPIWSDPIHDKTFVNELLELIGTGNFNELVNNKRLNGMLRVIQEELEDVPLYYTLDKLCRVLKLQVMPMLKFRSTLLYAGYRVSFSHASKNSIKTNAPAHILWDILRCWDRLHPVKEERKIDGTPLKSILCKPSQNIYNLSDVLHPDANPLSRRMALTRYQENPAPYWGPGTKAKNMASDEKIGKNVRNQNKKQKRLENIKEDNSGKQQEKIADNFHNDKSFR